MQPRHTAVLVEAAFLPVGVGTTFPARPPQMPGYESALPDEQASYTEELDADEEQV